MVFADVPSHCGSSHSEILTSSVHFFAWERNVRQGSALLNPGERNVRRRAFLSRWRQAGGLECHSAQGFRGILTIHSGKNGTSIVLP